MTDTPHQPWLEALQQRHGRDYWRSLEELLDTPEFRDTLRREFPAGAAQLDDGLSRRNFVKLLGASLALAGVGACVREPSERILPYVDQPPEVTPGIARYYATSMVVGGYATGLLAESHVGRPTKLEGNPTHPASLGAAGVYEQASVLQLYDPERSRAVHRRGTATTWDALVRDFVAPAMQRAAASGGAGLRFLLEPTSSPLVGDLLARLAARFPSSRAYFHDPLEARGALDGARLAFGQPLVARYDLRDADVVLAVDADVLGSMPFHLRYARQFAARRAPAGPGLTMNRLYAVEGTFSVTGASADHRLRVRTRDVQRVLAAILAEVVAGAGAVPAGAPASAAGLLAPRAAAAADGAERRWVRAVAQDLRASAERSAVVVGERQPAHVHVLAHLLNAALGNVGRTVAYAPSPILEAGEPSHDLAGLAAEMAAGAVDTLVVLDANPSYTAPADLEFRRLVRAVPHTLHVGLHANETAADCAWHAPAAHFLEAWGDARAYDGTVSFTQPLIAPLWGGRTPAEVLALFDETQPLSPPNAYDLLRARWMSLLGSEAQWEDALRRGLLPESAFPAVTAAPAWDALPAALAAVDAAVDAAMTGMEIVFLQDASVRDGRFANNAWLQELPDPLTKLTWGNAALVSPATARRLAVDTGGVLRLRYRGRDIVLPALALPGHADDSISLHFGYGREGAERLARGVGADAYRLWTTEAPYFDLGLAVESTGERVELARTQDHWALDARSAVLGTTLDEYRAAPEFAEPRRRKPLTLYDPYDYRAGDQWAMVVDLNLCTGCSACVVACQAENNVPVAGADGVRNSREMHWLRIDRYFAGSSDDPLAVMQPMLCQHCEQAPCEYVCPVNATVHSPDGLNEMVYNRCVGTRFCSNNCPYKVRRFNWFDYHGDEEPVSQLVHNPDVTVRERGVMEKCTFCVQRIRGAQQAARIEGRDVAPGEVTTACQQACPTQAIVFGSSTDPDERLLVALAERRRYAALHDLGTRPRVTYLARITNPNPALAAEP